MPLPGDSLALDDSDVLMLAEAVVAGAVVVADAALALAVVAQLAGPQFRAAMIEPKHMSGVEFSKHTAKVIITNTKQ